MSTNTLKAGWEELCKSYSEVDNNDEELINLMRANFMAGARQCIDVITSNGNIDIVRMLAISVELSDFYHNEIANLKTKPS